MDEVRADKAVEATHREQSLSCSQPATGASRCHTCRWHTSDEPQQAASSAMADISDTVRAKVANWMIEVRVMDLITSDEPLDLGEEPTPAPYPMGMPAEYK